MTLRSPRNQRIAAVLAFAGILPFAFTAIPAAPLVMGHKMYLGQWRWALMYGAIAILPIPWIAKMAWVASILEGIWYLIQEPEAFDLNFNAAESTGLPVTGLPVTGLPVTGLPVTGLPLPKANPVLQVTDGVRELDQLRQDGLISEYEFEQKRRRLLDRIG